MQTPPRTVPSLPLPAAGQRRRYWQPEELSSRPPSPPNAAFIGNFGRIEDIFYGTDDGFIDGSFREVEAIERHYRSLDAGRRESIHLISPIGGLYGLNLIPVLRPTAVTFFDLNPYAILYFELLRRAWLASSSAADLLRRLSEEDYPARSDDERFIRHNIAVKQRVGHLPRQLGSSKRSFESSWRLALEDFELTRERLAAAEVLEVEMNGDAFQDFVLRRENLWLYSSNIFQFFYFDLRFERPSNVVLVSIVFYERTDLLDLCGFGPGPVQVRCRIPMSAESTAV